MKQFFTQHVLRKTSLLLLLALTIFIALANPIAVLSFTPQSKYSDADLFKTAFECESKKDFFCVLIYLFAYKTRDPTAYLTNAAHKKSIDDEITRLTKFFKEAVQLQAKVNADLKKCECYPCAFCTSKSSTYSTFSVSPTLEPKIMQIPPDMAVVCEHYDYQGKCSFLMVGSYNSADQTGLPNDSISSVIVGSNVRLTLCIHGGLTGTCTTFQPSSQDPNLSDNPLDNQYNWNDNTTSIRVDNK